MQNKKFRFGPVALTTAVTNILNPGTTTGGVNSGSGSNLFIIIRHIAFVNKTSSAHNFSAWLGATGASAAGTEVIGTAKNVPANDTYHWYGEKRLDVADFLTMSADANTSITVEGEGEIGIA